MPDFNPFVPNPFDVDTDPFSPYSSLPLGPAWTPPDVSYRAMAAPASTAPRQPSIIDLLTQHLIGTPGSAPSNPFPTNPFAPTSADSVMFPGPGSGRPQAPPLSRQAVQVSPSSNPFMGGPTGYQQAIQPPPVSGPFTGMGTAGPFAAPDQVHDDDEDGIPLAGPGTPGHDLTMALRASGQGVPPGAVADTRDADERGAIQPAVIPVAPGTGNFNGFPQNIQPPTPQQLAAMGNVAPGAAGEDSGAGVSLPTRTYAPITPPTPPSFQPVPMPDLAAEGRGGLWAGLAGAGAGLLLGGGRGAVAGASGAMTGYGQGATAADLAQAQQAQAQNEQLQQGFHNQQTAYSDAYGAQSDQRTNDLAADRNTIAAAKAAKGPATKPVSNKLSPADVQAAKAGAEVLADLPNQSEPSRQATLNTLEKSGILDKFGLKVPKLPNGQWDTSAYGKAPSVDLPKEQSYQSANTLWHSAWDVLKEPSSTHQARVDALANLRTSGRAMGISVGDHEYENEFNQLTPDQKQQLAIGQKNLALHEQSVHLQALDVATRAKNAASGEAFRLQHSTQPRNPFDPDPSVYSGIAGAFGRVSTARGTLARLATLPDSPDVANQREAATDSLNAANAELEQYRLKRPDVWKKLGINELNAWVGSSPTGTSAASKPVGKSYTVGNSTYTVIDRGAQ